MARFVRVTSKEDGVHFLNGEYILAVYPETRGACVEIVPAARAAEDDGGGLLFVEESATDLVNELNDQTAELHGFEDIT